MDERPRFLQDPAALKRALARGVQVFRWVALAWMVALALTAEPFRRPELAWTSIGAAAAWTAWLTFRGIKLGPLELILDLGLCSWLILASGLVVSQGEIVSGRPFFATGYPISAALLWGIARGPLAGLFSGGVLGLGLLLSRPMNGIGLTEMSTQQIQNVAGAVINYLVAGVAVGSVARLLLGSAEALEKANAELVAERERTARLKERESLARRIHDSVLQALALVHKRGNELAKAGSVPGEEVKLLAAMAGRQEAELRNLITREPEEVAPGLVSLREALDSLALSQDIATTTSYSGELWMERARAQELLSAVRQALENIAEHAGASRTIVFAQEQGGSVTVTVRDDGVGFEYDEEALVADGKVGLLRSMKGRVEDLGGSMAVISRAGSGTEIEFVVPLKAVS